MKNLKFRLQALCFALLCVVSMSAQEKRYVVEGGAGAKNGSSWSNAYANIQDAINDLVNNNLTGEVWVKAGDYYPTETTEASNSPYYKSFKIPAGITVRGGFAGTESSLDEREIQSDKNFGKVKGDGKSVNTGNLDGEASGSGVYKNKTVLHGDLNQGRSPIFTWNPNKNQFDATFFGNSYHVVWFAMNGFSSTGRANPLTKPAKLEGCVVEGGNALSTNTSTTAHPHIAYGGGIYMVANSFVYNCEVRKCAASRNGGGIYMDGGGIVRRTYVHDCQALGLGTEFGLGGGICEDGAAHNSKSNPIVVAQSAVTNCVGRMGGGMALVADKPLGNAKYTVVANSTLVNNNTAQVEAGGVYTYKGGGLSSMTIVRNKCYGSGVTLNEVVTGRSGGVYSRDASYIGNTVIWGNECSSNNDVQYASSQSSLNSQEKSKFYYNALSKADNTDWSYSTKMGLHSLADENSTTGATTSKGFPLFFNPTQTAGYLSTIDANDLTSEDDTPEKKEIKITQWTNWQVSSESFLSYAGIATVDLDYEGLTPAPSGKSWDMQFGEFNSRPTIGALISQVSDIAPAKDVTYEGVKYDYAFFVDPDFIYAKDNEGDNGTDWEHPARFLGSILDFIAEPKTSNTFLTAPDFTDKKVAVFVKQGTVDNTRIKGDSRVRVTTLDIPSNVALFGSFNSHLVGTDLSLHNVVHTPTVISGKLMDKYDLNVAHLININDKHNVHVRGFQISYANASSTTLANANKDGAAITVTGSDDITFHDIIVNNCTADHGAAVYADKSTVLFENCIFHNNQSKTLANSGIVYGINGSVLDFIHCDVLRNVGHASYLGGTTTNHWQNSIFYGNLDRPVDDTNIDSKNEDPTHSGLNQYSLAAFDGNTTQATGHHCMFDFKSASFASQFGGNDTGNQWQYDLQYAFVDGTGQGYPRFINPTKNAGVTEDGNQTYYGRAVSFEPHNNNPIVNMASHADIHTSWGKDIVDVTRDFGGLPDIGAVENHVANQFEEGENAYTDGQKPYGDAYYVRDYASDEGTTLTTYDKNPSTGVLTKNASGKGIYNAAGELLDGASWEYAVNGNGMYSIDGSTSETLNTVFKTESKESPSVFAGTFTIKVDIRNTPYYIYIDNSGNTKITQTAADASHFEIEGINTSTVQAGDRYIRTKVGSNYYYLNASPGRATSSTDKKTVNIAEKAGKYTIAIGGNYYYTYLNWLSYALGTTVNDKNASTWTFTADMTDDKTIMVEVPYQQDGKTEVTSPATKSITADAEVKASLDLHVYNSLEDYNNSQDQKTYTIKRNATTHYLRNSTVRGFVDYFYPGDNGDKFILIQDGEYGKYYIYDVTTNKYLYYSNGLRASATYKSTWWVKENNSALSIVYGNQSWDTTGNYALSIGTNNQTAINLGKKDTEDATLVLVAQSGYAVYNYESGSKGNVNLNGLQYAVNLANEKFAADSKTRGVYVAKGIYTNYTPADANSVSQPYAYMMKDGVNVYGGFPVNGNPGMNERQPKEFETILQPQSESPYVTLQYGSHNGTKGNLGYNPDIMTVPTGKWGSCISSNNDNDKASVGRVLVQPADFNTPTSWDGFTLRYGYLNTSYMYAMGDALTRTDGNPGGLKPDDVKVAGGAGALLQGNGILSNCVVFENVINCVPSRITNNTTKIKAAGYTDATSGNLDTYNIAGAGVLMTGASSTAIIENCEIGKNQALMKAVHTTTVASYSPDHIWIYGAGLYQNGGNVYNTILHDNFAGTIQGTTVNNMNTSANGNNEMILGAGAFVAKGNFYNNTVVNNFSCSFFHCHNNHCTFAGVHVFAEARIYNTLIAENESYWGYKTWTSGSTSPGNGVPVSAFKDNEAVRSSREPSKVHVFYSFVNVEKGKKDSDGNWVDLTSGTSSDNGSSNIYIDSNNKNNWDQTTYTDENAVNYRKYYTKGVYNMTGADQYKLLLSSPCFNSGTEAIKDADDNDVTIPDYDAEYTDRIKDCTIDIGAYEYNGAAAVTPQTTGAGVGTGQAVFYVTHNGYGNRTGEDPKNAACAAKLQVVLDAAGRYKYLNPGKQVIVKVANDWDMLHPNNGSKKPGDDGYVEPENFTYYATRTTDWTDQDVRVWSIMVPRGVEVWGGYTDVALNADGTEYKEDSKRVWNNTHNGFMDATGNDLRDITGNPTYFDSHYVNKLEKTEANTYHVVTFTDRIFDQNGLAYTKEDFKDKTASEVETILRTGAPSTYIELPGNDESLFAHMSEKFGGYTGVSGNVILGSDSKPKQIAGNYASNRAVIDGIFVSGGQADASTNSTSATVNINSYGGAALVNEFAYVRNCILVGNTASNGGALALTDHALVTGCLIMENEAQYNGGAIYVFEDGTKLSDGRVISTALQDGDPNVMDYRMSHVMTSTIVNNNAGEEGGGVWYTTDYNTNVRFNSVAIWNNTAKGQENVYGMVNPEQPTDDATISEEFYPFSYSIIQNLRASGTNNLNVTNINRQGMRFVQRNYDVDKLNNLIYMADENGDTDAKKDFGFYGLTTYSLLCSAGMPKAHYNQLKSAMAIADNDLLGTPRVDTNEDNIFVEVGARALAKEMPKKQLMLRLFVAHPEDVDTETATSFMELAETATEPAEEYYSQEGSSFAYPFNSLQQALDYIKLARNGKIITSGTHQYDAQNLPFEILVGKGEWYPKRSLNSETQNVWAATYAIPEGVTIIGGFNPQGGGDTYYGRYYEPIAEIDKTNEGSIYDNVTSIPTSHEITPDPEKVEIGRGYNFGEETVNGKKFQQWNIQDIADRRAMKDINNNGIIEPWEFEHQTIISGNAVNGETDGVYHVMTAVADADAVGNLPKVQSSDNSWTETGYKVKEEGQQIRLNGLVVTGGNALTYLSTALDDYGSYIFYQGAGLQVDGNRYKKQIDAPSAAHTNPVFYNSAAYGVGYRDIPVSITNCQFRNNKAGYGGAISTNGSLSIFGSSFEQNIAYAQTEKPAEGEEWISWVGDQSHSGSGQKVTEVMYPGQGGAILATHQLSAFNTLFANNEARYNDKYYAAKITPVEHPTFRRPTGGTNSIRATGGAIMMGSAAQHHIVNCDFVRNKANAYPAVFTMNPTKQQPDNINTHKYSQIINTVAWGNEVNKISSDENYLRASKLMVNIGKKARTEAYDPTFNSTNIPSELDLASDDAEGTDWQEASWFCAYEDGMGFKPNNTNDLREAIVYSAGRFAPTMIKEANGTKDPETGVITPGAYQNCNILIAADNRAVDGPNFGDPSVEAGYDGFTESADWSPTRFNLLTDNGNGWIRQTVEENNTHDDYIVTFHNDDKVDGHVVLGENFQGAYSYTHYISDIAGQFPEYRLWLAIGNEKYMKATNEAEPKEQTINGTSIGHPQKNLPRISPDPVKGVQKAYIDIGVYEYQKPKVIVPGGEVDILWVSTQEKPENGAATGLTWKTPMTDLQQAIETLLTSRNGHKKEIRLMEGEYAPITPQTVGSTKYSAFVIDTKSLNERAITPSTFDGENNDKFYAQSITIKGGYSSTIPYEYDPVAYKTTIRQKEAKDGSSTNYLIYIADPTVRYAYAEGGYKPGSTGGGNMNGAIVNGADDVEAQSVKTMPIQIDGVTLINDKAATGTKGSAIYYPDYTETAPEANITGAHSASAGGKVIYYETKADLDSHTNPVDHETEFVEVTKTGAATITDTKLIITKAQVVGSGNKATPGADASAVYIGEKGGAALIYNSVFHSNNGMPLDAWNTVNVNNTFGKNKGLVQLKDNADVSVASQMHNSALWRNNNDGDQVHIASAVPSSSADKFSYNSYTGGPATDTNGNSALVNDNSNIGEGPNFVDPENVDVESRNYDIKPSIRLLNKGNGYRAAGTPKADDPDTPDVDESKIPVPDVYTGTYADKVVTGKYDLALASTTDKDVIYRTRIVSQDNPQRIDIGAYEFQGNLFRVLYVDPNKSHSDEATGENWDKAFGYGDLQDAEDLAAIYHMSTPQEEAYVFVKGNSATNTDMNTNETLTIRDGVTTYGSIISSYNEWHGDAKHAGNIPNYIEDMTSQREGVASNAASKTIVTGIKTDKDATYNGTPEVGGHTYETPALVDGFVVTNPNSTSTPVLDITSDKQQAVIVVRNVVVADNNVTGGANVAQISNGLLYEALIRDNKTTGAALKVSNNPDVKFDKDHPENTTTRGFAVNVTVEGTTVGADGKKPVDGMIDDVNVESATQIFKSITNSINGSVSKPNAKGAVAPYGAIINPGISGYFYNIDDANLNYQLTETSKYIDMCALDVVETEGKYKGYPNFLPDNLKKFINYTTDRDILGNPRLLSGLTLGKGEDPGKTYLDRGAFETWKVQKNFICGEEGTIDDQAGYGDDDHAVIKKHFYPHDGSVVYVMENMNLVIDPVNEEHEVKPTPENPGYLLVQNGASFYGNGRPVTAAYVAIERNVRKGGSIVAVPYAMDFDSKQSVMKVGVDSNNDRTLAGQIGTAYKYSGDERMDWKYIFQTTDTKCWDPISETKASQGVLYDGSKFFAGGDDDNTTAVLRFTGKGANLTDYVYREDGVSKDVTLTKYDDAESTNNGADFTDNLDMGWNCFGIPYLVSNYKPYETATTAEHGSDNNGKYMMNIPHTLWLYYDGKVDASGNRQAPDGTTVNGDGGYYSVKSWSDQNTDWHIGGDAKMALWVGEGIFTQTATLQDSEALKFYRPIAPASFSSAKGNARFFYDATGVVEIDKDPAFGEDGYAVESTEYYTVNGMKIDKPRHGVVIIRETLTNGKVRTIKRTFK